MGFLVLQTKHGFDQRVCDWLEDRLKLATYAPTRAVSDPDEPGEYKAVPVFKSMVFVRHTLSATFEIETSPLEVFVMKDNRNAPIIVDEMDMETLRRRVEDGFYDEENELDLSKQYTFGYMVLVVVAGIARLGRVMSTQANEAVVKLAGTNSNVTVTCGFDELRPANMTVQPI